MDYIPPLNGDTGNPNRGWPNANPGAGVAGARIDGRALEYPMREILEVINYAGLAPNNGDLTQLRQAMMLLIASGLSSRIANMFQAGPTSPASMKVQLTAGHIFSDASLTEIASQQTATLTAPAAPNSRIDRIVVDRATGVVAVVAGTPSTSPAAPAIPTGKNPVARVLLTPTTTSIAAAAITDERDLFSLGLGLAAFKGLSTNIVNNAGNLDLNDTGVGAGSVGDSINIPQITFDAKGRATAKSTNAVRTASTSQTGVVQGADSAALLARTAGRYPDASVLGTAVRPLLATLNASSSASLVFSGFDSSKYAGYEFVFEDVTPGTNAVGLQALFSTDGGSSWLSAGYAYSGYGCDNGTAGGFGQNSASQIGLTRSNVQNGNGGMSGFGILGVAAGAYCTKWTSQLTLLNNASNYDTEFTGASNSGTTIVNAIKFQMSSGVIASGTIRVYGIPK